MIISLSCILLFTKCMDAETDTAYFSVLVFNLVKGWETASF